MTQILEGIDRKFQEGEVAQAVARIVKISEVMNNPQWYELAFSCIDLTTLNSTDNAIQGDKFAKKVSGFEKEFPGLPNVAAICVYPTLVKTIKKNLLASQVNLASVAAGFPSSQTFLAVKELEIQMAVADGANEIDIVLNLGNFLAEDYASVIEEISILKKACGKAHLKVILETGALKTPEKIWKASHLAMQAGADFIKTSTGKMEPAATLDAAWVMCSAIKDYFDKTQKKIGFKAAGGIVQSAEAIGYIGIVKELLGDQWLNNKLFRIGASRLANNLLTSITGEAINYF